MAPSKIHCGTWVPRTTIHLKEFYRFLQFKSSHLHLNQEKLRTLHALLHISNLKYHDSALDIITAQLGDYNFNYQEDGVVFLSKTVDDLKHDFDNISHFMLNSLLDSFSYLYSQGAPIPKVFTNLESVMPIIITTPKDNPREIDQAYNKLGDTIFQVIGDSKFKLYFGDKLITVVSHSSDNTELVRYLIFLQDYKNQMEKLLNIHRYLWDQISLLREKKRVRYKDLALMRDMLLNLKKDITYFNSRLSQMHEFVHTRKEVIDTLLINKAQRDYCLGELTSLSATQAYMEHLWDMTERYADSTLNLISLLYQENEQSELNTLQVIFIIGVISSLLSLGAMPGAMLTLSDQSGIVLQGQVESFSLISLLHFGSLAFVLSTLLYISLHFIYTNLKRFRVVNTARIRAKSIDSFRSILEEL